MSNSTTIAPWCISLRSQFDAVVCVALRANGDSAYRDARALRRLAREKWGVESVTLSDADLDDAIRVNSKTELLQGIRTMCSSATSLLFVVSAHGYSAANARSPYSEMDGKSEYLLVNNQRVYDFELRDALLGYSRYNLTCFALIDTCHSGTMLDLDFVSTDGLLAYRTNAPRSTGARAICVSACQDSELAGEDVSSYAGWGGKLVALFLDYATSTAAADGVSLYEFYRIAYETFSTQELQKSHPVFSFSEGRR